MKNRKTEKLSQRRGHQGCLSVMWYPKLDSGTAKDSRRKNSDM